MWPTSGSDSISNARVVIRHRWIIDEDKDLSKERASNDTDQHKPNSIGIQEWLEECRTFMTRWLDPSTIVANRSTRPGELVAEP